MDTLPSIIAMNLMIDEVDRFGKGGVFKAAHYSLRIWEAATMFEDFVGLSNMATAYATHKDLYNAGKMTGKTIKLLTQLYFEHWFSTIYKLIVKFFDF